MQSLLKDKVFKTKIEKVLNVGLFDQKIIERIMSFDNNDTPPVTAT